MENKNLQDLNVLTDEYIVKMAQEGSNTAYEFLINKYKELVKNKAKAYYIAGADSEDVVQEGTIGLFKAIRDFDEDQEATFKTFADICVTRQIITAIQAANRKKHQILNESLSLNESVETESGEFQHIGRDVKDMNSEVDPETMMLMKEVVSYLKMNQKNLFSPLENRVFDEMLKDKNYKEIAVSLRRSPKAIDNAIQRIKKKVQTYLEK